MLKVVDRQTLVLLYILNNESSVTFLSIILVKSQRLDCGEVCLGFSDFSEIPKASPGNQRGFLCFKF